MAKIAKDNNSVRFDENDVKIFEDGLEETCSEVGVWESADDEMTDDERRYSDRMTALRRQPSMGRDYLVHMLDTQVDSRGNKIGIKSGVHNVSTILNKDRRIAGSIGLNLMSGQVVMLKSIKFGIRDVPDIHVPADGADFNKGHEAAIAAFLGSSEELKGYGIGPKTEVIRQAILNAAYMNAFDPLVQKIYETEWDGVARMETSFVRWFNLDNNPYNRALSKFLLAFIERRFNPGAKFDHVPVLISRRQGTFKSTSVEVLSLGHYGEFRTPAEFSDPKKLIEATEGAALMEVPEMAALLSLHHNVVKSTISARKDRARGAYAISATTTMRSWLMLGTSNDGAFLRDPTGNRRFWPIYLNDKLEAPVNIELMRQEILQVYAEALVVYREMRKSQPHGDLPYHMTGEAAEMAQQLQARAAVETPEMSVAGWLKDWLSEPYDGKFSTQVKGVSFRSKFCLREAFNEYHASNLREAPDYDAKATKMLTGAVSMLGFVSKGTSARFGKFGVQQSYEVDPEWLSSQIKEREADEVKTVSDNIIPVKSYAADVFSEWDLVEAELSTDKKSGVKDTTGVSLTGNSVSFSVATDSGNVISISTRK